MPAKQRENEPIARTNARKPGNPIGCNKWLTYTYSFSKRRKNSLVQNIEIKVFLSGFK